MLAPPSLAVFEPVEEQVIKNNRVKVVGKTDDDAVIKVNNQPVLVDDEGNFSIEIQIVRETSEISVKAISRSGKETVVNRKIVIAY